MNCRHAASCCCRTTCTHRETRRADAGSVCGQSKASSNKFAVCTLGCCTLQLVGARAANKSTWPSAFIDLIEPDSPYITLTNRGWPSSALEGANAGAADSQLPSTRATSEASGGKLPWMRLMHSFTGRSSHAEQQDAAVRPAPSTGRWTQLGRQFKVWLPLTFPAAAAAR